MILKRYLRLKTFVDWWDLCVCRWKDLPNAGGKKIPVGASAKQNPLLNSNEKRQIYQAENTPLWTEWCYVLYLNTVTAEFSVYKPRLFCSFFIKNPDLAVII